MKIKNEIIGNVLNISIWMAFLLYIPQASDNVYWSVSRQFLTIIFITLGLMVEMISGMLDLAFMAEISVSTCIGAYLLRMGTPVSVTLGIMLLFQLFVGGLKGWIIAVLKVNPVIITLALQIILSNLLGIFTGDTIVLFDKVDVYGDKLFWRGILFLFVIMTLFLTFVLKHTYYGKYIRMLGENIEIVRDSGLPFLYIQTIISMLSSVFFWVSAVIILFITSSGSPSHGSHYLFLVIAASSMGGISFFNGRGNIWGAVIGTLSIVMSMHLMVFWGIQSVYETILIGFFIIMSIILNTISAKN